VDILFCSQNALDQISIMVPATVTKV